MHLYKTVSAARFRRPPVPLPRASRRQTRRRRRRAAVDIGPTVVVGAALEEQKERGGWRLLLLHEVAVGFAPSSVVRSVAAAPVPLRAVPADMPGLAAGVAFPIVRPVAPAAAAAAAVALRAVPADVPGLSAGVALAVVLAAAAVEPVPPAAFRAGVAESPVHCCFMCGG